MGLKDFNETFRNDLADQEYAAGLLADCLNEATVHVSDRLAGNCQSTRRHDMAYAKETELNRESLYKSLANGANPEFRTIIAILKAVNIAMSFCTAGIQRPAPWRSRSSPDTGNNRSWRAPRHGAEPHYGVVLGPRRGLIPVIHHLRERNGPEPGEFGSRFDTTEMNPFDRVRQLDQPPVLVRRERFRSAFRRKLVVLVPSVGGNGAVDPPQHDGCRRGVIKAGENVCSFAPASVNQRDVIRIKEIHRRRMLWVGIFGIPRRASRSRHNQDRL